MEGVGLVRICNEAIGCLLTCFSMDCCGILSVIILLQLKLHLSNN